MSDSAAPAFQVLLTGARALARADGLDASLRILLGAISEHVGVESAAIFVTGERQEGLELAASIGLGDAAAAGLSAAVRSPTHPIARTFAAPRPVFDVRPTAPGGPALRSHLPLVVTRGGTDLVLGVLALAHERPIDAKVHPGLEAVADLAAVAIERSRTT